MEGLDLEGILAALPSAVMVLDGEGRTVYVNPAAAELLDQPRSTLMGKTFYSIFSHFSHRADEAASSGLRSSLSMPVPGPGLLPRRAWAVGGDGEIALDYRVSPMFGPEGDYYVLDLIRGDPREEEPPFPPLPPAEALLDAKDKHKAWGEIARHLSAHLDFPILLIDFYDRLNRRMACVGATGIHTQECGGSDGRVPVSESLSGMVARSGRPIYRIYPPEIRTDNCESLRKMGIRTFFCVPIRYEGAVWGTLTLAHQKEVKLDLPYREWVGTLADRLFQRCTFMDELKID